jgi:hypothetical protein
VIFLLEYSRRNGRLVSQRSFTDDECSTAEKARLDLELVLRNQDIDHEVVILEATNEAALRITHRRYFENLEDLAKSFEVERVHS